MNKVQNSEIAEKFNQVADLLEIEGANPFRIRAYRNAARTLNLLPYNINDRIENNHDLTELPGIGKDLSAKIEEIVKTGKLNLLNELKSQTPLTLIQLLKIPHLGPKRLHELHTRLEVNNIEDLEQAIIKKSILNLPGFGEKISQELQKSIKKFKENPVQRMLVHEAEGLSLRLIEYLKTNKFVRDCTIAGSYRRCRETVGDIDILVTGNEPKKIISHFLKYPATATIISQGETKSSVQLKSGIQVDLRVIAEESWGAALIYFTGSKAHNIALRNLAIKQGYKINEYGLYRKDKRIASLSEKDIYNALKLPLIEPELRENTGELQAGFNKSLPNLIKLSDIRGDLHTHTIASDGTASLTEMCKEAQRRNYSYIAVTDHSKHVTIAHGLNSSQLLKQLNDIEKINLSCDDFQILKSSEIDILEDGSLDYSDEILAQLDIRVCAVHYKFNLPSNKQSERIIRAMKNKYFNILAHPSGRLLGRREAYKIDMEKIMKAANLYNCAIELNAQPERLDISDRYCRMAKDLKVKVAISTDAHSTHQFDFMKYGIGQARRGWLEKSDVINTMTLSQLKNYLKKK